MDLDDEEYYYNKIQKNYVRKDIVKKGYIRKDKIRDKIKELEFEIKHAELDKCSQYYDYFNYRKFAINKLKELLEEE